MKCKVRLTRTVELIVEGKSEDAILEWLCVTTPEAAYYLADGDVQDEYDDEIVCYLADDAIANYVIEEDK
jgi:hypothetical protein